MTAAQDTVAEAAAYLDCAARGLAEASAALKGIPWPVDPPPAPSPPPPTNHGDGYNPDNTPVGVDQAAAIGAWRGSPLTAYNVFQYGHKSRQAFADSISKPGWTPVRTVPILAHTGVMPILTIPGSVGEAKPDVSYADVAHGALDAEHKANAAFLQASGPWKTDVALRIARECNTPGSWHYGATPGDRASWRRAIAHLFNDIYAPSLPSAVLVFCVTKRAADDEWIDALPLDDVPRDRLILGLDAYLNRPFVDTPQGFKDNWLRLVEPKVGVALGHGLRVAFPEFAVTDEDQPGNITRLLDYSEALGAAGHLHHRHYFGSTPSHALFGATKLPKSAAAYVEWWRRR